MADSQWQKLDGDAELVRSKGERYREIADAIERATSTLGSIVDDASTTAQAMDATKTLASDVKEDISKATERYRETGDALVSYASFLDVAISDSETAATQIAAIEDDLASARTTANNAQNEVDDLPHDPPQGDVDSANSALTTANARVTSLEGSLSYWQGHWNEAREYKDSAARGARDRIDEVVTGDKVNGLEDGFWDKAGEVWDAVYKYVKIVCDIAGVLAIFLSWVPFLGQVLVALAALGAILAIIDAGLKFARGKIGVGGLLVGVGLGVLSLAGGKAVAYLSKAAKLRTVTQSTSAWNAVAGTRGGARFIDDALTTRLPTTGGEKFMAAMTSPFTKSAAQREVSEAFASRSGGFLGTLRAGGSATLSSAKEAFPLPFKDGMNGVLFRGASDLPELARMLPDGTALRGPAHAAMALGAATTMGDVLKGFHGLNSAFNDPGKTELDQVSSVANVPGSHAGGAWNTAIQAPNNIINDLKTLGVG